MSLFSFCGGKILEGSDNNFETKLMQENIARCSARIYDSLIKIWVKDRSRNMYFVSLNATLILFNGLVLLEGLISFYLHRTTLIVEIQ